MMNFSSQPMSQNNAQPVSGQLPLSVWGATDKGRQREGNEDSVFPESGAEFFQPSAEKIARMGQLLVVADGMGGAQAGSESSRWAIRVAVERYYDMSGSDIGTNLRAAVEIANHSLYQYLQSTGVREAGCTMTAAVIHNDILYVANVGDSRAYLLRNGQITQLTHDHTVTQQKIDQGIIRLEQAAGDPDRNVITRSIGTGPQVRVDIFPPLQLVLGDRVLLCSDGLTDMVGDAEILKHSAGNFSGRAAKRLIDAANQRGGIDNISVVMAQVGSLQTPGNGASLIFNLVGARTVTIVLALLAITALVFGAMWLFSGFLRNSGTATPIVVIKPTQSALDTAMPSPEFNTLDPAATPGKATSTPMPTSTRAPTFTPRPTLEASTSPSVSVAGQIVLLSPPNGNLFSNPLIFMWQWPLKSDEVFEVILRHELGHQEQHFVDVVNLEFDLPSTHVGQWEWSVRVLQGDVVVAESPVWFFWFDPLPGVNGPDDADPTPTCPSDRIRCSGGKEPVCETGTWVCP